MKQGLRTDHSTAGGLRHRKNLRGEATIQLRSRKEKWDVGDSPGTMWMKDIDEPEGANQCGKLNRKPLIGLRSRMRTLIQTKPNSGPGVGAEGSQV